MKHITLALLLVAVFLNAKAETPAQIIFDTYNRFSVVKNFKSVVDIHFDIPSINISEMKGKVFYAAPNKFKIRLTGVAFLPKQSPFELFDFLRDSTQYIAVRTGTEKIQNTECAVLSVLPKTEQDVVMEKIWVSNTDKTIIRSEVTSKSKGTVKADYFYGSNQPYPLPAKVTFSVDLTKFKLPKMISADLNSKKKYNRGNGPETGTIVFDFKGYVVNKGVDAADFKN